MKTISALLLFGAIFANQAFAIDSEPILKGDYVAIDSEPILKINPLAIDSEPILKSGSVAIDSEPILKQELSEFSVIYKDNDNRFIKVTYKPSKAEDVTPKEGARKEKEGKVTRVSREKKPVK